MTNLLFYRMQSNYAPAWLLITKVNAHHGAQTQDSINIVM